MEDGGRLEGKVDRIAESVASIDKTLVRQEEHLAHHIKRTDLLEEQVEKLRADLNPVKAHVTFVQTFLKVLLASATMAAAVTAFFKALFK